MEKPNIWRKKTNPDIDQSRDFVSPYTKNKKKIADIDMTFDELKNPEDKESLIPVFELLRAAWVGNHKDRETSCGIGTMYVYFDEDGHLHMDFATRFALPKESQEKYLKVLRRMMRSSS